MSTDILLTLAVVLAAAVLFLTAWLRADVVALLVLCTLAALGLVSPAEAISGFSSPVVVTIWAVFVLSGGLYRTGVGGWIGRRMLAVAGRGEARLITVLMLTAGILSAFMNNVAVAALLLPVTMDICRRTGHSPSRLLLPVAFGSILGGVTTLIGTPPNLIVSEALRTQGLGSFGFFAFVPTGLPILLAGAAFMALVGRHLLPKREEAGREGGLQGRDPLWGIPHLLSQVRIPPGSSLAGRTLAESRLGSALGVRVLAIARDGRLELAPGPEAVLAGGARLVIEGDPETIGRLREWQGLELLEGQVGVETLVSESVGLAEVRPSGRSALMGKTLGQIGFRNRYGVNVLAAFHGEGLRRTRLRDLPLDGQARLLVQGERRHLERLAADPDLEVAEPKDPSAYRLYERLGRARVAAGSSLAGRTLAESRLGEVLDQEVLGILRGGELRLLPSPAERLQEGDVLLLEGRREDLAVLEDLQALEVSTELTMDPRELETEQVGFLEAVLSPQTRLVGRTLRELQFREKYGLSVLAIWREGTVLTARLTDLPLRFGDALLLYGPRERLLLLGRDPDFLVLTHEAQEPPRQERFLWAAAIMLGVAATAALGWAPIYLAAVAGAALMVVAGCLTAEEAYRFIGWRAVFLIAGMLPLGVALERSGTAQWFGQLLVGSLGSAGPLALMAALFLAIAAAVQVMPNAAVAVLVAPVALTVAQTLEISPHALLMTVAMASSGGALSPVSHPANVLVMGPGGYRFADYLRVGVPLMLVLLVVTLLAVPLFWPLQP